MRKKQNVIKLYGVDIDLSGPFFVPGIDPTFNLRMQDGPAKYGRLIVWQEGDKSEVLRWIRTERGRERVVAGFPQTLLADFIELESASDNAIFAFAVKWGRLGLWPVPVGEIEPALTETESEYLCEPVSLYRRMSCQCKLILTVKALMDAGYPVESDVWSALLDPDDVADISTIDGQRRALHQAATHWIVQSPFYLSLRWPFDGHKITRPHMHAFLTDGVQSVTTHQKAGSNLQIWTEGSPYSDLRKASTYRFAPPRASNTFGAIVAQMVAALVSPNGIPLCKICGRPLVALRRKPRSDRSALCGRQECSSKQMKARSDACYQRKKITST